jgi:hypothetical protein
MAGGQLQWQGMGRWLSFAVAAALIVASVPDVLENNSAAGWNLFLGLLLLGAVASGNRQAPLLLGVLTALMALRLVIGLAVERDVARVIPDVILLVAVACAWLQIRRQAISFKDTTAG